MSGYWNGILTRRISRRRALAGTGALAASAAFLAACGGSSGGSGGGDKGGGSDKSGLLTDPKDTSAQAKPGGVWVNRLLSIADTMEPVAATGSVGFTHTM